MFLFVYNIVVCLYGFAVRIAAGWNPKARLWVRGRKQVFAEIRRAMEHNTRPVVWMHSASLGEFEQGRPLVEALRAAYPDSFIAISFFSPSGYEAVKGYEKADLLFYLPLPTRRNARRLVTLLSPRLVLWIKYDYWYHYLSVLKKKNIPLLLVSAIFHRHQPFFRWYGPLYRKMLRCFSWLFVQSGLSEKRLRLIGIAGNVTVSGDTRFDRVAAIAGNFTPLPEVERFIGGRDVLVAGSTWPEDEEILAHYANTHPDICFIIAPHEIDAGHIRDIRQLFRYAIPYSQWNDSKEPGYGQQNGEAQTGEEKVNTLIIDNIGMLSRLYSYATVAYVGGGFGSEGVHNVLEAAVYGKPVVFGPVFNQFREAIDLLEEGAAFTIETALGCEDTMNRLLADARFLAESATAAKNYVQRNQGATGRIMRYIQENRLLIRS